MDARECKNLLYRRQFIITKKNIKELLHWKMYSMCEGGMNLYAHPDLEVCRLEKDGRRIVLLGYIFDWRNPQYSNGEILESIFENGDFDSVVKSTYRCSGRFVIIYEEGEIFRVFHDAGAQREVHYHIDEDGVSCASQLTIIKEFLGANETDDESAMELYRSREFLKAKKQWPGEDTIYKNVKCLRPNHYLDIKKGTAVRYWPSEPLQEVSCEQACDISAKMLKGFIEAAGMRRKLLVPVTAGWDSRLLLAATRDISENVRYFVIRFPGMDESDVDIAVPKRLMKKLGLDFEVISADANTDPEFKRIFRLNTAYPREENLPGIYSVFHRRFGDHMNISSHLSEIVRSYCGTVKKLDGRALSEYIGYDCSNEYVTRTCSRWLKDNRGIANDMNMDVLTLFDWEESNWEASHRTETDIALEEFCPFSCRELLSILVSVDTKARNKYECTLYRKLMDRLWPQVMSEPVNPSFSRSAKGMLVRLNVAGPLKRIKRKASKIMKCRRKKL